MGNLNINGVKENSYDAIVIGSGISGGWAAKEFTEKGLKTLVLERGRDVQHLKDYPTTNMNPWEFEHRGQLTAEQVKDNPVVSKCYAFREDAVHFFRDSGAGIPQEKMDRIFTAFNTNRPGGTGLGLYLVREIVEAHQGTVTIESTEGKGTTVIITLPLAREEVEKHAAS